MFHVNKHTSNIFVPKCNVRFYNLKGFKKMFLQLCIFNFFQMHKIPKFSTWCYIHKDFIWFNKKCQVRYFLIFKCQFEHLSWHPIRSFLIFICILSRKIWFWHFGLMLPQRYQYLNWISVFTRKNVICYSRTTWIEEI